MSSFISIWGKGIFVSMSGFVGGSLGIVAIDDQDTHIKEILYSWLLVFFNAYIGIFIANKAVKSDFTGFFVWAFLINGFRTGVFLILLLVMVKYHILNERGFVLMTLLGYFAFLAAEIYGLQRVTADGQKINRDG